MLANRDLVESWVKRVPLGHLATWECQDPMAQKDKPVVPE